MQDASGAHDMQPTEFLTLKQAAALCPSRPTISTVWRWCRNGVETRTGRRVRLEHRRIGKRIYTSKAELERFWDEVTAADLPHFDAQHAKTRPAQSKGHRDAEKRLREKGVL